MDSLYPPLPCRCFCTKWPFGTTLHMSGNVAEIAVLDLAMLPTSRLCYLAFCYPAIMMHPKRAKKSSKRRESGKTSLHFTLETQVQEPLRIRKTLLRHTYGFKNSHDILLVDQDPMDVKKSTSRKRKNLKTTH